MTSPRQGGAKSALRLTGAQRRLMQKLAHRVDRVTQADRLLFERWPDWQRRKQVASGEVAPYARAGHASRPERWVEANRLAAPVRIAVGYQCSVEVKDGEADMPRYDEMFGDNNVEHHESFTNAPNRFWPRRLVRYRSARPESNLLCPLLHSRTRDDIFRDAL